MSRNVLSDKGRTTAVKGTPAYISPEIWKGEIDERTDYYKADIYAFGILLNFMFTKIEPNVELGTSLFKVMVSVTGGARPSLPEPSARCPDHVVELIKKCWDEEPSARPQDFAAVLDALRNGERSSSSDSTAGGVRASVNSCALGDIQKL